MAPRPLKRYLQHELETRIGRALLSGEIQDGSSIMVDVKDGELVVTHSQDMNLGSSEALLRRSTQSFQNRSSLCRGLLGGTLTSGCLAVDGTTIW